MVFIVLFLFIIYNAFAQSGTCGTNCTWIYDSNSKTLRITGTGNMKDWSSGTSTPWYSYRSNIKTIIIGEGITTIGSYSFAQFNNLKTATIPESVIIINNNAFDLCFNIESIQLPKSLQTIGNSVFSTCSSLTKISIPNNVTSLGSYLFYECKSLTYVNIPSGITILKEKIFYRCSGLKRLTIPSSLTSIESYAFYDCSFEKVIYHGLQSPTCSSSAYDENLNTVTVPSGYSGSKFCDATVSKQTTYDSCGENCG